MDAMVFEIVGGVLLAALVGLVVWMFRDLKADIRELRAGQQRANELLMALANHRHGDDGAPGFNLPGADA